MDKLDAVVKKLDELTDVVLFIKDRIVRSEEKIDIIDTRTISVESKLDGINNRIDLEVDKRKSLEVRTAKLEEKVF